MGLFLYRKFQTRSRHENRTRCRARVGLRCLTLATVRGAVGKRDAYQKHSCGASAIFSRKQSGQMSILTDDLLRVGFRRSMRTTGMPPVLQTSFLNLILQRSTPMSSAKMMAVRSRRSCSGSPLMIFLRVQRGRREFSTSSLNVAKRVL